MQQCLGCHQLEDTQIVFSCQIKAATSSSTELNSVKTLNYMCELAERKQTGRGRTRSWEETFCMLDVSCVCVCCIQVCPHRVCAPCACMHGGQRLRSAVLLHHTTPYF